MEINHTNNNSIEFIDMTKENVQTVYNLELDGFLHPWSFACFTDELKNDLSCYKLMLLDKKPIAYAGIWTIYDEAHVTKIAVSKEHRGKGFGKIMMRHMIECAKNRGAEKITLEVREHNIIAQNLYKSIGFSVMGVRKKYYSDTGENGIIMWLDI